jgi:hypothetical protein
MSRKGDCWDNAVAESFFSSFGFELEFDANWRDVHDVERDTAEYIDGFYNPRRRHSHNGYLSPIDFDISSCNKRKRPSSLSTEPGQAHLLHGSDDAHARQAHCGVSKLYFFIQKAAMIRSHCAPNIRCSNYADIIFVQTRRLVRACGILLLMACELSGVACGFVDLASPDGSDSDGDALPAELDTENVVIRCGAPRGAMDVERAPRFALLGPRWNRRDLTWGIVNSIPGVGLDEARAAAAHAFAQWTRFGLRFTEEISIPRSADITIMFTSIDGMDLGIAHDTVLNDMIVASWIELDEDEPWSTAQPPASDHYSLARVMAHEIGHAIGLGHSSVGGALMFPSIARGDGLSVNPDDIAAQAAAYTAWQRMPGAARDITSAGIHAGPNGLGISSTWLIGTNPVGNSGFGIYHWNIWTDTWQVVNGAAVRVAVDPDGNPWVINASGTIYRGTVQSDSVVRWTALPGAAREISIASTKPLSAWVVGTNARSGGHGIYHWDDAHARWTPINRGAEQIAVAPDGFLWTIDNLNGIFRKDITNALGDDHWEQLPGSATDIAISPDLLSAAPGHGYAWVIGTTPVPGGRSLHLWDEQHGLDTGDPHPPEVRQWIRIPGGGTSIAVQDNERVWLVNASGEIYRTTF